MRVLCVGRHSYLSEHLCSYFQEFGVETTPAVGIAAALELAPEHRPDAVICDYDLLATLSLETWERDPLLSRVPVIAVSLTRRPTEVHLLDINSIAGFLYLPSLTPADVQRVLAAASGKCAVRAPVSLPWPPPGRVVA